MHFSQRNLILVSMLLTLIPMRGVARADVQYTITDLETSPIYTDTRAYAINAKGQVAGESHSTANAAFWDNGVGQFFLSNANATAINATGLVAGTRGNGHGGGNAYTWQNGAVTNLPQLEGATDTKANGVNDKGQVVGEIDNFNASPAYQHPCLWTNGQAKDLGTNGYNFGWAFGINNKSQVVGMLGNDDIQYRHGFLWDDSKPVGKFTDLRTLGGKRNVSYAYAVNDASQVVGFSDVEDGQNVHAFLWQDGRMQDIHSLVAWTNSIAYGINGSGTVVGSLYDSQYPATYHAFVYYNGAMTDLNKLTDNKLGWTLYEARAINDAGQIVGFGLHDGKEHAFLLTPGLSSSILTLMTIYPGTSDPVDVDGIACDNLRSMDPSLKDCLIIPLPDALKGVAFDVDAQGNLPVTDAPDGGSSHDEDENNNVGTAKLDGDQIRYYPPDEFNRRQQPRDGHTEDITKEATRAVYLHLSGTKDGQRVIVEAKKIILARPPVVLVHGINNSPSAWDPFILAITGMDPYGNESTTAEDVPITEIPFVAVNHYDPLSFPNGLDTGNEPVEIGAMLLAERIQKTLSSVRSGTPITDADELDELEQHQYNGYKSKHLAIRRVDVVAWSYGGVITRWYLNRSKPSDSNKWYLYTFRYTRHTDRDMTYSNTNLPIVTYNEDVRKVITLGSMWRGVPFINYGNESIFSSSQFGTAPVQGGTNLFSATTFLDATGLFRFLVPSMEVMAIESSWMRQLVYGNTAPPDDAHPRLAFPFDPQIAYGSVAGNDQNYPLLPLIRRNLYADMTALQKPSWFPYLILEQRNKADDGYSDGLVPLWSASIPGSYTRVFTPHKGYASNAETQYYVVLALNNASLPRGSTLTSVWNDQDAWNNDQTAVQTKDKTKRWHYIPGYMAPYPQNEIYTQIGAEGRLSPFTLGSSGKTYPDVFNRSLSVSAYLTRDGADVIANISFANLTLTPSDNVPLYDVNVTSISLKQIQSNSITYNGNLIPLGTIPQGVSKLVKFRFPNMAGSAGQVYGLTVSYKFAASDVSSSDGIISQGLRLRLP